MNFQQRFAGSDTVRWDEMAKRPMKVLVASWGSTGDILPPIAIGGELARRGHDVTFAGNPYFSEVAARVGLAVAEVGTTSDHRRLMADADVFDRNKTSAEDVYTAHYYPHMPGFYRIAAQAAAAGPTIIVGGEVGSAMAAEKFGLPFVQVVCSPGSNTSIRSRHDPVHPERLLPPWAQWFAQTGGRLSLLYRLNHLLRRGILRWPAVAPPRLPAQHPVAVFRASVGLPETIGIEPRLALCMWPEWFAPQQSDWPAYAAMAGFALYPRPDFAAMPQALDPGAMRPVVVTTGSVAGSQAAFYARAVAACVSLGLRALLITPHKQDVPADLPATIEHLDHAPFHELFGQALLVVHHGGIGTAAYALAAGIPQIVMPLRGDQFDNANRLQRLGVAKVLSARDTDARQLAQAMRTLLDSSAVARQCRHWQARTSPDEGLRRAADFIEAMPKPSTVSATRVTLADIV